MYGISELAPAAGCASDFVELLYGELGSDDQKTQAMVAEGVARLLYAHRIPEPATVLEEMLVLYYHPSTSDNYALRQCLTYFFPAFSYMSHENQAVMQQVTVSTICRLGGVLKQQAATSDGQSGATQGQAAQQMVTWADPRILEAISAMNSGNGGSGARTSVRMGGYTQLGIDGLKRVFKASPATRKVLVQTLNKLSLDEGSPQTQLQQLFVLTRALAQKDLFTDMITRNALARFEASLLKLLDLESIDDANLETWLEEPEMASVFEFVSSLGEEEHEQGSDRSDEEEEEEEAGSLDAGSDLDSPASPVEGLRLSVGSAMSMPISLKSRSPLKRAREERIEELTREIDELLDSDSDSGEEQEEDDDDASYMSAEE
ncbi:chromosome condensation complex Condensin, subunit G [Coemansia aciculifera]|nr:chromosome condensation complex Condensin, subunit G [Coemansia aciculifera]